jgi:hypothetical protein
VLAEVLADAFNSADANTASFGDAGILPVRAVGVGLQ